jgi:hypothetical protein
MWIAVVLIGAWLLYPILTPAHVEGFSASIVSIAQHLNAGRIGDYDRLHPANLEYFALSRLGAIAWLSVLTGPFGLSGEWAMRLTMWLGFAALASSSFILARRWTKAPSVTVVVALLLIPGVTENAFFYNDTILAAALGTTALAVLSASPGVVGTAVSGVLFGCAIVARLDAVLLGPAMALVGYEQHGLGRQFWSRAGVFAVGATLPVVLVPAALHASIFDIVAITRYAISLWGNGFRPAQHAREASLFLGIPGGVLVALGCVGLARRGDYRRALLLVGVPALFNLVALGKIWQSRQLLPMTPFLVALAILGWRHTLAEARKGNGRSALTLTVVAICGLAWLAPILLVVDSDGPRAPYGRLWTPPLWRRWQNAVSANFDALRFLVASARPDSSAIITDTWDADRYLHLTLQEAGYTLTEGHSPYASCDRTAEEFTRGARRILHIRLHQPFLPNWSQLAAARLEEWGRPCLISWRPRRIDWLAPLGQLRSSILDSVSADLPAARTHARRVMTEAHYAPQVSIELSVPALELLRRGYTTAEEQESTHDTGHSSAAAALADAERRMAARVWRSPRTP